MAHLKIIKLWIIIIPLFVFPLVAKAKPNLCSVPPFCHLGTKPNVLIVMDFSGSMQFPAYFSCAGWTGYWGSKVADCAYSWPYYAYADYDPNEDYYGIFESDKYYKYEASYGYFSDNTSNCNYTDRIGAQPNCISGNLLNFVTTSRIDAALKALIGGKADCSGDYCLIKAQGSRRRLRVSNIHCQFYIRPEYYWYGSYSSKRILLDISNYNGTCPLNGLSGAYVVLKTGRENRKGVIQQTFDKVRYAFMVYGGYPGWYNRLGEIRYGFHENDLDTLLEKMQTEVPYNGTPTGEALWEAYDYLIQQNSHSYESNSSYISKGTEKDPYYDLVDSTPKARPCRKSSILLISDGEWNGNVDPVRPARTLWFNDIRSDLEGKQNVKIYSFFAFSSSEAGKNSMKTIATFGSFKDLENCTDDWPYTFHNYPSNSLYVTYPRPNCDPDGTYNDCCQEWDEDQNGVPDTFFYASNGRELEESLTKAVAYIIGSAHSAGAVATVTQEVAGEDVVIRGAFTTYEPDDPTTYVWRGHLEVYWPMEQCLNKTTQQQCEQAGCTWDSDAQECLVYSFQNPNNKGKFCSDAGFQGGHCWDAGERLQVSGSLSRNIFTYLDGEKKEFSFSNVGNYLALDSECDFNGDGNVNDTDKRRLIDWVKGTTDGDGTHMRNRHGWVLGDIVYSTPVVVGAPSLASVPKQVANQNCNCSCVDADGHINDECAKQCFYCYRYKYRHRKKVVYVGANDGMVHAFIAGEWDESQQKYIYEAGQDPDGDGHQVGEELWAYIPSNLLSELKVLAKPDYGKESGCQHRTMVDLAPQAWDVYIDRDGDGQKEWRTVLVGGERGGGDVYFAIDITDPTNPQVLWEYSMIRNLYVYDQTHIKDIRPFSESDYEKIKNLPFSYSMPYVARLKFPSNITSIPVYPVIAPMEDDPANPSTTYLQQLEYRYFAFIGGGIREFSPDSWGITFTNDEWKYFYYPYFAVIDIETGYNLWQLIWSHLLKPSFVGDVPQQASNYIPYAVANPLVLDVYDDQGRLITRSDSSGPDGYADLLYAGDLNGNFYTLRLYNPGKTYFSNNDKLFCINIRKTKPISSSHLNDNNYRDGYQPITATPTAAVDQDGHLRVYFGTGKFDNVGTGNDDKSDKEPMSFYCFVDNDENACSGETVATVNLNGNIIGIPRSTCDANDTASHHWVKEDGTPDGNDCFTCIYDFEQPGERVIDSALVAGELVFVTTFVPSDDPCSGGGDGYLYVFDYMCRQLTTNPLEGSGLEGVQWYDQNTNSWKSEDMSPGDKTPVVRAHLGGGMPSHPVLDSSGGYVLIQTSDAKIHRIKVNLPQKPLYLKGWREED